MTPHRGSFILTFSGIRFYPLDPRPEEVRIIDIAHALSNLCRFNGHTRQFYSVAQHAVHVAEQLPPHLWFAALAHDDAEFALGDITRPLKSHLFVSDGDTVAAIEQAERRIMDAISTAFAIPPLTVPDHWKIKAADNLLLHTEARDLMPHNPSGNWWDGQPTLPDTIIPWQPEKAKAVFLERFHEYKEMR